MSDQKNLETGLAAPVHHNGVGSVTPSDMSFVDEKEKNHHSDEENEDISEELQRVESAMYPSGLKMVSILVGVVLSMFLVALDMVRSCYSNQPTLSNSQLDDRRNRHSTHNRSIQVSR
jgi:hypothetical protein